MRLDGERSASTRKRHSVLFTEGRRERCAEPGRQQGAQTSCVIPPITDIGRRPGRVTVRLSEHIE